MNDELFMREAEKRAQDAEAERVAAAKALRGAPHGEILNRRARLQAATHAALAAEAELQRLRALERRMARAGER